MSKELTVTHEQAIEELKRMETPIGKAIIDYITAVEKKNIAILGTDEAFILTSNNGEIKAFKKALTLSVHDGTLTHLTTAPGQPIIISAQGYEVWAEATGTSVIFPKEVLVGNQWKPNPYAERDESNRRILAVHARAIAFKYSSMGIPQVSDWTTIFDTPSYRMIDLLSKAKKFPQCFKVLPKDAKPEAGKSETWASYPFDESMNLWINTSHDEVITWLSQILNREKKAMDFAQTFAKRNALKHLSGLQKAPANQWRMSVLAWRPTGNNIIKWDATQYADLQKRVAGMIEGDTDDFKGQIELNQGSELTSEDENVEALEADVDPEDSPEFEDKSTEQTEKPAPEPSKTVKQIAYLAKNFKAQFEKASTEILGQVIDAEDIMELDDETAIKICQKVDELVNAEN